MKRKGKISRKTKETSISVDLNIDGKGKYKIDTGIGFLNHMLEQLSKHSSIDMKIKAKGDTHIDLHHTTEDTGIAIGEALKKALKKSVGIRRYAHAMIPMDETLSRVAIDISNRPYLIWKAYTCVNFVFTLTINIYINRNTCLFCFSTYFAFSVHIFKEVYIYYSIMAIILNLGLNYLI